MELENKGPNTRFIFLYLLIAVCVCACVIRLIQLQVVNGAEYKEESEQRLVRVSPIKAPRGEIMDRYGRPLVTNRMGFYVQIRDLELSDEELNAALANLIRIMQEEGAEYSTTFPIKGFPYYYEFSTQSETDLDTRVEEWKKENKLENYQTPEEIIAYYKKEYKISEDYSDEQALNIIAVRYEMEVRNFGIMTPYTFATDVSMNVVQKLKEQSSVLSGISVEVEPIREYASGTLAAHILGRTGIIYREEYEQLKDQGYGMNDYIGKDGMEQVLESYLKGKDGYKSVEQNRNGNVSQVLESVPATPGNYAILTIDAQLQQAMEESLANTIAEARARRAPDARCGAAIAVEVQTGEVLAMASYPSYDPATYNENYNELLNDPTNPLFNRALNGVYEPGSTFKPLTAIAALEEGVITPTTIIEDKGVYEYYAPSYTPSCLEWSSARRTHGKINVSQAIGVSCNYFFYEIGRLTGIEKMNEYARAFGLGESTGIELSEADGILAGPEYRESIGQTWYPGDTIQAAIGQSDNLFTPAQIVNYLTTFLNRGTRHNLHLLKEIKSYETGEVVYRNEPQVLNQTDMKDSTYDAVKEGLREVVADGTASSVFADFPIQVGGKTGTAQVSQGDDTVLFMGFAPFDNPQIAVVVVLEHGASSSYAARVARDVLECYFSTETPQEEEQESTSNGLLE